MTLCLDTNCIAAPLLGTEQSLGGFDGQTVRKICLGHLICGLSPAKEVMVLLRLLLVDWLTEICTPHITILISDAIVSNSQNCYYEVSVKFAQADVKLLPIVICDAISYYAVHKAI